MARQGFPESLLESGDLHGPGCRRNEFATMRPQVVPDTPDPSHEDYRIVVVYMEWCGECGAADWEVI